MKFFLALLICILVLSCSKDSVIPAPSFQYRINGKLVVMNNIQKIYFQKVLKGSVFNFPETIYGAIAINEPYAFIDFSIAADSLTVKNYHYDSIAMYDNRSLNFRIVTHSDTLFAYPFFKGDYYDINITKYKSGRVSGTFSAKCTPGAPADYNNRGTINITDGIFENMAIKY